MGYHEWNKTMNISKLVWKFSHIEIHLEGLERQKLQSRNIEVSQGRAFLEILLRRQGKNKSSLRAYVKRF